MVSSTQASSRLLVVTGLSLTHMYRIVTTLGGGTFGHYSELDSFGGLAYKCDSST